jgi:hypothetical protein
VVDGDVVGVGIEVDDVVDGVVIALSAAGDTAGMIALASCTGGRLLED